MKPKLVRNLLCGSGLTKASLLHQSLKYWDEKQALLLPPHYKLSWIQITWGKKGPLSSGQIQQVAAFNVGPNTNTIYYSNNTELATSQNISFGNTPWEFSAERD